MLLLYWLAVWRSGDLDSSGIQLDTLGHTPTPSVSIKSSNGVELITTTKLSNVEPALWEGDPLEYTCTIFIFSQRTRSIQPSTLRWTVKRVNGFMNSGQQQQMC